MADRYQDKPFPADDDYGRGDQPAPAPRESDPLAELARLIGQTDPFAMGRANHPVQPARDQYRPPAPADDGPPAGPPPWMQRANRQEVPPQDYASAQDEPEELPRAVHPLHRYAAQRPAPEADYHPALPFPDAGHEPDPSRYDEALYGQLDASAQDLPRDPAYPDDPYAYQDDYGDDAEDAAPKRGGGMITVVVVLALAVLGTGAAFAYRTYVGSPRSGEPPIIRADTGPTKIVPTQADANAKVPDRMAAGDGTEKIVPREEAPVDVNTKSGPRVVFPPLNPNANPPAPASVTTSGPPPATAANGTLPNNEPRRIKTLSVPADAANGTAAPVTTPPATAATKPAVAAARAAVQPAPGAPAARAPAANAPLSLSPQTAQPAPAAEPRTRVAATTPEPAASSGGGNYLVQVSSQRNEADAQASFRALQGKFPSVLGSRAPLIKRADLGDKGVYYRAMVGPFGSPDEASQFCGSLKTAGGQCVVQRN
jgi:cell division septation protein DedD